MFVQNETPYLLSRSIVQGFGLGVGFFLAGVLVWIAFMILLGTFFHFAAAPFTFGG